MTIFSLQSLNLSSSRPESHDESWSLQGKLQRPLTDKMWVGSTLVTPYP